MPSTQLRLNVLAAARRVVVKVGTQTLNQPGVGRPKLEQGYMDHMADQVIALRKEGRQVTLVCSGAIGAGCAALGFAKRPTDVSVLQAVASVGQRLLMTHLHDAFARHGVEVGQVLLTREDIDDRARFINIRNCLNALHELGCVPVINENDTVAVDEIRFGDNDTLAALVANAIRADALVLLTVVDGMLDAQGCAIDLVESVDQVLALIRDEKSALGTGGITTKLAAARIVTQAGEVAVIANGRTPDVLTRLFKGERLGTVFQPARRKLTSRSRWIGLTSRPAGSVTLDDGAIKALRDRGKSLLARGITACEGHFGRGQVLSVRDAQGGEVARGLTNYPSEELRLIMGRRSTEFQAILGREAYDEVIHRDNLVLAGERAPR